MMQKVCKQWIFTAQQSIVWYCYVVTSGIMQRDIHGLLPPPGDCAGGGCGGEPGSAGGGVRPSAQRHPPAGAAAVAAAGPDPRADRHPGGHAAAAAAGHATAGTRTHT